jgi:hypothetical protein
VVTAPIAVNSRGIVDAAKPGGRNFKRAAGVAILTVALAALAALLVGTYESQASAPAGLAGASARVLLPGDLFAPPRAPNPRVVVRYMAPRNAPAAPAAAPVAAPAAEPSAPMAMPSASSTPGGHHRPSPSPHPSPSPSWGGDD